MWGAEVESCGRCVPGVVASMVRRIGVFEDEEEMIVDRGRGRALVGRKRAPPHPGHLALCLVIETAHRTTTAA